ncbi:carnitine O-acetyltransferase activity [Nesidiocoris tenuis]|uniref:Carnitine O-acetyltransferase activity n=1 Tax=Nesidiocoris tenuis TaxID=355587 RepID=A0ABN7AB64_9HEMI|nr:carnitine O-acetyltransferase activity [Nesidiocoris tenuis]
MARSASAQVATMPRYPVAPLNKTLERYLKSAKPFLSREERIATEEIVKTFGRPGGVGELLQEKLNLRAEQRENWLEEWWINTAYLEYRDPVVVFSSPGLLFPPKKFANLDDQLDTAAKLAIAAVSYKALIDNGKIVLETFGKAPLDMSQYYKIFGTNRHPCKPRDVLAYHPSSKHIIVVFKNNYYKVDVIKNGSALKPAELLSALKKIAEVQNEGPRVGLLTSEHRDTWADIYAELRKDPSNACSLKEIEESLFLLCIDSNPIEGHRTEMEAIAANLVHGACVNSSNRWYDKTIQFIVGKNCGWGLNYEHSPAEGQAIARLMDHIIEEMEKNCNGGSQSSCQIEPVKLPIRINNCINDAIKSATNNLVKITDDLEFNCIHFTDFGKNAIKKLKVSPDSFLQMAMQYAFYRTHKTPGAHYETGSTRMFMGGRTETIRSCSEESIRFAQAMLDCNVSEAAKARALLQAINAHKEYTLLAMSAQGVDRHLLGLRKIAAEEGITEGLEIFQDVGWTRSTHMRLSTSQVAAKCDGFMIYGPLVKDGYACCYNPQDDAIFFGTSAWRSCCETDLLKFGDALQLSLREMRSVLEKNPKAKL